MRARWIAAAVLGVGVVLGAARPASALSVALRPSADTTILSDLVNFTNGTGDRFFAGNTRRGATRRALLRFDVASSLPIGARILDVQLELRVSRARRSGSEFYRIHRITSDWGEGSAEALGQEGQGAAALGGDATWNTRFFDTTPWTTQGGDFVALESAKLVLGGIGTYTFSSTGLRDDVQLWLDHPGLDYGWMLRGNEASNSTAKRFNSREHSSGGPTLTIEFTLPEPSTLGLLLASVAALAFGRHARLTPGRDAG